MGISVANFAVAAAHHASRIPAQQLLQVRNLRVRYRSNDDDAEFTVTVLDGIDFNIAAGEFVGLLGESGCGKTTTALSLLSLVPDNARVVQGSVLFADRDLLSLDEPKLRRVRGAEVALIYQDSSVLNPVMRAGDQVSEVLRAHRRCTAREARQETEALFASIGLSDTARIYDAYPHQLSGGQRQRIAISQALICKPRLVIADEPTASVDKNTARQILDFLKRLQQSSGTSFLFISHDPATLASLADRIMVMYAGQIVESGPVADVYSRPLHPYTRALLQCAPRSIAPAEPGCVRHRLPTIPGSAPDRLDGLSGCSFANRCSDRMPVCDSMKPVAVQTSESWSTRCFKYEAR